jgi:hypothetical protein
LIESFGVRPFLTEVLILPDSPLVNKTLEESNLGSDLDLTVLQVVRNGKDYLLPADAGALRENDLLIVEGAREEVLKIKDISGIEIKGDVALSDPNLHGDDTALVEAILLRDPPHWPHAEEGAVSRTLRPPGSRHEPPRKKRDPQDQPDPAANGGRPVVARSQIGSRRPCGIIRRSASLAPSRKRASIGGAALIAGSSSPGLSCWVSSR